MIVFQHEETILYLVSKLQMQVTWFGMEPEINSFTIIPDDVLSSWVVVVSSSHKLLHAETQQHQILCHKY